MKTKLIVLVLLGLFISGSLAFAAEPNQVPPDASKANVAVLFINNAKVNFDAEVTKKMTNNLDTILNGVYNVIPGEPYIQLLIKNGIEDISTAERQDIVDVFKGKNVDYIVFVEVQPFNRKETGSFFTRGKEMIATVPMKLIDVANNKYFFNGKFVERAKDSTVVGAVGDKSVGLKALDAVILKMNPVIQTRLPLEKSSQTQQ